MTGYIEQHLCQKVSENLQRLMKFANASGALTAFVKGAIQAVTGEQHILNFINTQRKTMSFGK